MRIRNYPLAESASCWFKASVLTLMSISSLTFPALAGDAVVIFPAPRGEEVLQDYTVTVEGRSVPVSACRVSAVPFNQVWPGYQRSLDQTELGGFASWDATGPVTVEVTPLRPVKSVVVRPSARGITPVVKAGKFQFQLPSPGQFTVELDGPHQALHLFYNSPETDPPKHDDPSVRYFGPGLHRVGEIALTDNQTIYIAGGAVVHGYVSGRNVSNICIRGRGILDGSEFPRDTGKGNIRLLECEDVVIDGVILRDPNEWGCTLLGCRRATLNNIKLIGLWRYNADGIDLCNSEEVVVRDAFVRSFDDGIVIKGLKPWKDKAARNIRVERCVVWCGWGRALEIGAETSAPEIGNVIFEDCDIIRTTHIAMDIQHGDRATVHDIQFRDIRVELDDVCLPPRMQKTREDRYTEKSDSTYLPQLMVVVIRKNYYSKDNQSGIIRDVTFQNIRVTGKRMPASSFAGLDAAHTVENVTIRDIRQGAGATPLTADQLNVRTNPFVKRLVFVPASGKIHGAEETK